MNYYNFKGIVVSFLGKRSMYLLLRQWIGALTLIRSKLSKYSCFANSSYNLCYILYIQLYPICSVPHLVFKFAIPVVSPFSTMAENCVCAYLYFLNWQVWTDNMLLLRDWQVWLTNRRKKKSIAFRLINISLHPNCTILDVVRIHL